MSKKMILAGCGLLGLAVFSEAQTMKVFQKVGNPIEIPTANVDSVTFTNQVNTMSSLPLATVGGAGNASIGSYYDADAGTVYTGAMVNDPIVAAKIDLIFPGSGAIDGVFFNTPSASAKQALVDYGNKNVRILKPLQQTFSSQIEVDNTASNSINSFVISQDRILSGENIIVLTSEGAYRLVKVSYTDPLSILMSAQLTTYIP